MLIFASSLLLLLAASSHLKRKRSDDDNETLPAAKVGRTQEHARTWRTKRTNLGELEESPLLKRQRTGLVQRRLEVIDGKRRLEFDDGQRERTRPRLSEEEEDEPAVPEALNELEHDHDQLEMIIAIIRRMRATDNCAHDTRTQGNPWGQGPGNAGSVC